MDTWFKLKSIYFFAQAAICIVLTHGKISIIIPEILTYFHF